jgi:pimeloyl-ACP methyl ester carboxylesterase
MRQAADTVAQAKVPVLVISGGYSPAHDATAEVVARLTHGRHELVSAPNHFVQQSRPLQFNEVVDAFMRSADDARKRGTPAGVG